MEKGFTCLVIIRKQIQIDEYPTYQYTKNYNRTLTYHFQFYLDILDWWKEHWCYHYHTLKLYSGLEVNETTNVLLHKHTREMQTDLLSLSFVMFWLYTFITKSANYAIAWLDKLLNVDVSVLVGSKGYTSFYQNRSWNSKCSSQTIRLYGHNAWEWVVLSLLSSTLVYTW